MVDVIKHIESGAKYAIPHGDPLPNEKMYIYLAQNIPSKEAKERFKLGVKVNPKQKC